MEAQVYQTLSTQRVVRRGAGGGDFWCYHKLFCHAISADLGRSAECVWIAGGFSREIKEATLSASDSFSGSFCL